MTSKELITLIEGDKTKLKKWFEDFDKRSSSINDWQTLLDYPLEPHSCQICHKIRNKIANGLSYHFGIKHLDGLECKGMAEFEFKDAIEFINKGEEIRVVMKSIYPKIAKLLYNN